MTTACYIPDILRPSPCCDPSGAAPVRQSRFFGLHFPLSLCASWSSDRRTLCRSCGASVLYATPLKAPAERQIVYRHYFTVNGVDLRLNHSPSARRRRIPSLQNLHSRNFCTARTTLHSGMTRFGVSPPAPVGTRSRIECPSCAVHSFTSSRMRVYLASFADDDGDDDALG
ncbi:hypothetical protein BJ912DRAFT_447672 [Pholiota molesta]|nr:hypothetical protein BJ912DRAFT_447672 [Pholiota molesta]